MKLQNSLTLILIQAGMVVSIPVLLVGYLCAQKYGFSAAIIGIFSGNFLIALFAFLTIPQMVKVRLTTPEQFKIIFGKFGYQLNAVASLISLMGWFAINLNLMNESVTVMTNYSFKALPIVLGLLIILVVAKGIRKIALINYISVPVLFYYVIYLVTHKVNSIPNFNFSFDFNYLNVFLFIFFATIVQFYNLPSYFRFAKNVWQAQISSMIIFLVLLPLMEFLGVLLGCAAEHNINLIEFMMQGQFMLTALLIISSFNINNINLYGSYLNLKFLLSEKYPDNFLIFILGSLGVFLSYFNLLQHFEIALKMISFLIAINAAIYIKKVVWKSI